MSIIKKGTIKSYDAAAHKAAVQIAGSLGVWLDGVRVATDIPAADVVIGRQCTVLFLDPSNQDDALVLTIQGAPPSGGGGGVTDHGALTGLGDDDHTQYGALAQAETWAALQTFSAGIKLAASQQIQDSGGTGRFLPATSSPHVTITGDVRVDSNMAIESAPQTSPDTKLRISPVVGGITNWRGIEIVPNLTLTGNNRNAIGLIGTANITIPAASSGHNAKGLKFATVAICGGAGSAASGISGAEAEPWALCIGTGKTLAITDFKGYYTTFNNITAIFGTIAITNAYGLHVGPVTHNNANLTITTAYGVRVEDFTGSSLGTVNLLEIGPTTPYLRLVGKAAPGANLTNLYLNENGTLRRVQWKDGASIGAGDRVMVLV